MAQQLLGCFIRFDFLPERRAIQFASVFTSHRSWLLDTDRRIITKATDHDLQASKGVIWRVVNARCPRVGAERETIMTSKKKRASSAVYASKAKPQKRNLPPDPDGLFKRAARRGKKVIAMYDELNPGLARDDLVGNIVLDLICLSDRDPTLGDVEEACGFALQTYELFVKENEEDERRLAG